MDLNLATDMSVTATTAGGFPVSFSRSGDVLTVNLDRTYTTGETVVVTVTYTGNPAGGSFGWSSHSGQDMIWTLSEPYGARDWWPCKDLNSDKADSVDIMVTVPDNLIVASNGLLVSDVDNGATRTVHWKSNYPIATYLVSLAIHPYTQYSDWYTPLIGGDPMEVQFFIYPDHVGVVETNYALTVPMIGVFAQAYGEYPFVDEKYGHAEFTWGGGMEHQTITSMGGWSRRSDLPRTGPPVVGRHGHLRRFRAHLAERGFRHLERGLLGRADLRLCHLPAVHGLRRLLRRRHDLRRGPFQLQIPFSARQPQLQQGQLGGAHAAGRPGRRGFLRGPGPVPRQP